MLKLSRKKKNAWLALAVAASILGGGTVFAAEPLQTTTEFTSTLTGDSDSDTEYKDGGVIGSDGSYKFTKDSSITTGSKTAISWDREGAIDANGKTLTLTTKGAYSTISGGSTEGSTINVGKLVINSESTGGRIEGITASDKLTINGDIEMNLSGTGYTLGLYTNGDSEITFNGNVTAMGNENSEWGLTSTNGAWGYYGCSLIYSGSNYMIQKGPKVTINGDVNAKIDGNGLFANGGSAKLTINGGGNIEINKDNKHTYYALLAECGTTSLNVNLDENYDGVSARGNKLVLKGNVAASTGAVNSNEPELHTKVNLGLATADSEWTGVAQNGFNDGGNTAYGSDKIFDGAINVFLQNGATWNNEKWGNTAKSFTGSHVAKFAGGISEANAGNIFQKDENNLTLDNYSGHTNIYYAHTGNGEAAENYAAGDTIIKSAAEGSSVSLITDSTDVAMNNTDSVANVLNALAGKLTYSNFATGEKNLNGYVKIADGLTASSKAMKTGNITFTEEGKGSYVKGEPEQTTTEFTSTLTGNNDKDTEYAEGGVIGSDGSYKFTKDSSITTGRNTAISWKKAGAIDASGKTLTLTTKGAYSTISGGSTEGSTINVGKLVINSESTGGRIEGISASGKLTINGDTEMNLSGTEYTLGLYTNGDSEITFNGNVTAMGNENSKWGLTSTNGAYGYYGCSLIYSGSNYSIQQGPKVTINGDVNAKIDGNGLFANGGSAKLTINGGGNIEINKDNKHTYYALLAECGTTSLNVNLDENYDGVSARGNKLVLKGNVAASTGAVNSNEPELHTKVNLGLATADSEWTGVAQNGFNDGGNTAYGSDKIFDGAINVFLQNGATWNNEKWGATSKPWGGAGFTGSHVAKFVGGISEAAAGNIFQKDANSLTIDNYSGNTNIYYAHEGNGEAAENYAAGDTVIKSAAEGSVVSMITDNSGIAMDNSDSVANVLNALAGKLTYSNFTKGEKNLNGYVKIADGLTASSKAMKTGDITFTEEGKGSYVKGEPEAPVTSFTTAITGDKGKDEVYAKAGVTSDYETYKFSEATSEDGIVKIDAGSDPAIAVSGKTLSIDADGLAIYADSGIDVRSSGDVTVKADKLQVHKDAEKVVNVYGGALKVDGLVDISAKADAVSAKASTYKVQGIFEALSKASTVNINGGSIKVEDGNAINAYASDVNINYGDEGALENDVKIDGDIALTTLDGMSYRASNVNLGLTTNDSYWNGVVSKDNGSKFQLTLQNGASWTNESNSSSSGSSVTSFTGGATEAAAGNIFQKDANSLTIDSYSGNTNIFYAHTGNGEAAEDYAAGDTIIKSAAEGSVVSMITDNSGITMDNKDSVANVLNALAGKLTYSNFTKNENNLTGYVKIADGLTASSKAMQTGNISFNKDNGKGSYEIGSMNPGFPPPENQTPESSKLNQGITGDLKTDYNYRENGILKEDGKYVFTQDPTKIDVENGAAVEASTNDINIDTTKAKLELKGETGIKADGANVAVKGSTEISGNVGIDAVKGNVTLNGSTVINGTDAAINVGANANVNVITNNSALNIKGDINADGGSITVDSGKASSTIKGDVNAANGGSVAINLTEKGSSLTGGYNVDGDSSIVMNIANGAIWHLTDGEEAAGMSLLRMAKGAADAGLTINGGKTEAEKGLLDMTARTKTLDIAYYSGWETIFYKHENAGDKVEDYKSGDTVIAKADKGSGVILSTDRNGITMSDKNAVEATLKALAQKVTYKDHKANGDNLTGKVQIAEGLTSSSQGVNIGTLHWDENGKGQYDLNSVNWNQITEGDYETFVMKGVRSAATTSMHTWRDNMQDTYTGADMADEDGMFAKALGGKTSSDVKGLKDSNTYYGVQVGYDKAAANGWHTGVAFDYRNGDSNYLLGGKGDNQMYSLGIYGVKSFDNDAFFRVAAKVGRVENEYDVYNEIRSLKLHGDYKANAYGLTMEYGKTFGDEDTYFTPKAQLTWSQVGAKDYTAHTDKATMQISQDSYSSFVGRLGFEAGVKSEKGRVYAGLFAAHEFNGDISASYFANDGDRKHTSFDGEETWMEMKLGGTYDFSNNAHLYADFAKDFNGNFERKWKLSAGLRFEF